MNSKVISPWHDDLMNRAGVAKFITSYIDSADTIKVLNVNAPWGSGKTFFIERWCAELKQKRACVYFNACSTIIQAMRSSH